ncbi:MAG: hypothetical protein ACREMJ_06020 [Gemmatimonadales bacterium]
MLKRILASAAVAALFAIPLQAQAKADQKAGQGKEVTITGQVVDMGCYAKGQSGEGHKMCAQACAKAGVPLGILGSDGTLYLPITGKPADPANPQLAEHAEGKVKVTGVHRVVNGLHVLELKSVTAAS